MADEVLIIDDDARLAAMLGDYLGSNGYSTARAGTGRAGVEEVRRRAPDAVILDVMLPDIDGFEACRQIRAFSDVPVLMLTAKGDETDRIVGLELGADDYLPKPFNPRELLARIRAVLRRAAAGQGGEAARGGRTITFAGWTLDTLRREVTSPAGVVVDLSGGEYDVLIALVEHPNRILSREQLLELARNRASNPFDRSIDVQISRIRRKLESGSSAPPLIKTVRGAGYIFLPTVKRW